MLSLLLALAAASAVDADPVPHFVAACRQEHSAAHCACVAAAMTGDAGGRFFLDMTMVVRLPDSQQGTAYAALLARYGVDAAGGSALRQRGQAIGDAAEAGCP
jgi:nitrate/nitrite transporter NarK